MRGWTSSLGGFALVGLALWALFHGGTNKGVLLLAAGALILFYRGYQGRTITEAADDAMLPASFVSNPQRTALAIVTDRIGRLMKTEAASDPAPVAPSIDVDAIMDRYMAERAKTSPGPVDRPPPAPGEFGRKGL